MSEQIMKAIFLILLIAVIFSGCIEKQTEVRYIEVTPQPVPTPEIRYVNGTTNPTPTPTPIDTPSPPGYTPTLRPYLIDKTQDIWHASDASSYITPDNEWVQYYAKNNLSAGIIFRLDKDMYPSNPDKDVWQNADYTLYKMEGDCEDIAIAYVSFDIASGKKAVVVGGYLTLDNGDRIIDFWEEVYVGGVKSIKAASTDMMNQNELRIEPLYMFNDKIQWQSYDKNWYQLS